MCRAVFDRQRDDRLPATDLMAHQYFDQQNPASRCLPATATTAAPTAFGARAGSTSITPARMQGEGLRRYAATHRHRAVLSGRTTVTAPAMRWRRPRTRYPQANALPLAPAEEVGETPRTKAAGRPQYRCRAARRAGRRVHRDRPGPNRYRSSRPNSAASATLQAANGSGMAEATRTPVAAAPTNSANSTDQPGDSNVAARPPTTRDTRTR